MLMRRDFHSSAYLGLAMLLAMLSVVATVVPMGNVGINGTRGGSDSHSHSEQSSLLGTLETPQFAMITEEDRNNRYLNFSLVLQKLLRNYDKRLRPNFGSDPVSVAVTMHVTSISGVSETEMDFTVDFYLRQMWKDDRLSFSRDTKSRDITVGIELLNQIWKPDTFFPNEKRASFHSATVHNSFLRISPSGDIYSSQRITVTAGCPMMLHDFPFDKQQCILELESYGYGVEDIKYDWKDAEKPFAISNDTWLPQFILRNVTVDKKIITQSTGSYSRLYIHFPFQRDIGFYMMQVYLPAIVVVFISLLAFWFPDYLLGDRIGLCFTAVLTMTVLMTTTSSNLPKISYVKAIDIYLIVSFMLIFITLIESCLVAFMTTVGGQDGAAEPKHEDTDYHADDYRAPDHCYTPGPDGESGTEHRTANNIQNNNTNYGKEANNEDLKPLNTDPRNGGNIKGIREDSGHVPTQVRGGSYSGRLQRKLEVFRQFGFMQKTCHPLDHYSRLIFPTFFIIFNAVYWAVYLPSAIMVQHTF